jgi:hypothetical protein
MVRGRDVPGFNFPAQVFIEHWGEEEVVRVADKSYFSGSSEVKSRKKAPKAAPENRDSWLGHGSLSYHKLKTVPLFRVSFVLFYGLFDTLQPAC